MTRVAALGVACALAWAPQAHAFGKGELFQVLFRAGTELAGAAIDKGVDAVKESLRDPEAEAREKAEKERKLAEQMRRQIEAVEARSDLRPIERERQVLQIVDSYKAIQEMEAFVERAEAAQKAQRDSLFTLGGIAGVVGEAAMTTPAMAVRQADLMARNPAYQAEVRARNKAVFDQAEAMVAADIPQAKARAAIAQADLAMHGIAPGVPQATRTDFQPEAGPAMPQDAMQARAGGAQRNPDDPFAPDLGRSLWVEFEGSEAETARLREHLRRHGHRLAAAREEADVAYLAQGEYTIAETKVNEGLVRPIGALLDNPDEAVAPPEGKTMGRLARGLGMFLLSANGAKAPQPAEGYRQEALLVIARQPKDGRETRVSARQNLRGEVIEAHTLARWVRDDLYKILGL